jgi:hypothetical protein
MCFSNLPIEFDENGDPSLAAEADDIHRPGCGCEEEVALEDLDPEEAFHDIVESVPEDVREHFKDTETLQRVDGD